MKQFFYRESKMKEHPYQETLRKMTLKEILDEMDEYGQGHYLIHEAAKRIRWLTVDLTLQKLASKVAEETIRKDQGRPSASNPPH